VIEYCNVNPLLQELVDTLVGVDMAIFRLAYTTVLTQGWSHLVQGRWKGLVAGGVFIRSEPTFSAGFSAVSLIVKASIIDTSMFRRSINRGDGSKTVIGGKFQHKGCGSGAMFLPHSRSTRWTYL